MVRPLEVPRPVRDAVAAPHIGGRSGGRAQAGSGQRLLVRGVVGVRRRSRARRALTGVALVAASAAVVVVLGLLVRVAEPAAGPAVTPARPPAPVVVTAEAGETVWEVAARVAPGRPGAEVAAVAERIVADNALRSVRLEPGQVLRVAGG
jgi:hypothetical protein